MHKHLFQLKRNNGNSSYSTQAKMMKTRMTNCWQVSSVRPVKTGLTTSNSSPPEKDRSPKKPTRQLAGKMVEGRQPRFLPGFESD